MLHGKPVAKLRPRQRLGKYVIQKKLGEGGFAVVYQARDTIEGQIVALKVPHPHLMTHEAIDDFRREVRLAARLEHPHVLQLKNADFIDGLFVIVTAMGQMTLDERLQKRISMKTAGDFASQMMSAVAYAHEHHIIHCDIKPENFLIFRGNHLRLTDFGIAKIAQRTVRGSGAGTVGYIAPEQALGRPSFRSDVFSLGLILYRMFSGKLPDWPYDWPPPNYQVLQQRLHADFAEIIRKAIQVDARARFQDARQMFAAFERIRRPIKSSHARGAKRKRKRTKLGGRDWKSVRRREFVKLYGKSLETRLSCAACDGPVSEAMICCPWCGKSRKKLREETSFPVYCPRCHRGMKLDWGSCPWCYGAAFEPFSLRNYSDQRYVAKCTNSKCERKLLMPFMRYCPWCRRRVKKKWKIEGSKATCSRCGWGVLPSFWSHCPWCTKRIPDRGG